jgi:hypothetical protein
MNDVYFFCDGCRTYIEAAYRHGARSLESCGLTPEDLLGREVTYVSVSAEAVLSCGPYWDTQTLFPETIALLSQVRSFLVAHAEHPLTFGDIRAIFGRGMSERDWTRESP